MTITKYKDIAVRISEGFDGDLDFCRSGFQVTKTAITTPATATPTVLMPRVAFLPDTPTFPSGVTGYIPLEVNVTHTVSLATPILLCEMFSMGTLNVATSTFTDGEAYPTVNALGSSVQQFGPVIFEWQSAAPTGTGRSITVTYRDQDNNTAETTASITLNNSSSQYAGSTLPLNSGDIGVVDITNATSNSVGTGIIEFWGFIPIATWVATHTAGISIPLDMIGNNLVSRIGANKRLGLFQVGGAATAGGAVGQVRFVGDN